MCFRSAIIFTTCIFLCAPASAQEKEDRKRFKHEKHGAIVYVTGDGYEIKCDIYQPKSDEPRPVMLAIHGGGWAWGSKLHMFRHARILANRGYVVMAINYRHAPQYKWPAQIYDCKQAVRWIRENADKYNADPDRVYAYGYSAGAHLATLLATTDADDDLEGEVSEPYSKHSSRIDGLIAGGAPMEFSWVSESYPSMAYFFGETRGENPEKYLEGSPITYVTSDDPVAVLYHGQGDTVVPVSSPRVFLKRYKEANLDVDLVLSNDGHIQAFSRTSMLIESLLKLEALVGKKECREKIAATRKLTDAFVKANKHLPESVAELGKFAVAKGLIKADELKTFALNERDGKEFEIRWSSEDGVIISEAVGVAGEKLSSRN